MVTATVVFSNTEAVENVFESERSVVEWGAIETMIFAGIYRLENESSS